MPKRKVSFITNEKVNKKDIKQPKPTKPATESFAHEPITPVSVELSETKVVPSIKPDKEKEFKVDSPVWTVRKLRVLKGIMIPAEHRTFVHGLNDDRVKIEFNKTFAWVKKSDLRIE